MKTVYKYKLKMHDLQPILMPMSAKPLHVEMQGPTPVLWAFVDTEEIEIFEYLVRIAGTGHEIEGFEAENYLNTFTTHNGELVWHVFIKETEKG